MHEVKTVPSLLCLLAQQEWSFLRNRTPGFASMFSSPLKCRSSCQLRCLANVLDRQHILFLEIRKSVMQTCEERGGFTYWLDWEKIKGSRESAELLRGETQVVLHVSVHISTTQILPQFKTDTNWPALFPVILQSLSQWALKRGWFLFIYITTKFTIFFLSIQTQCFPHFLQLLSFLRILGNLKNWRAWKCLWKNVFKNF